MATYTTNFNLEKPAQNEAVDVDVLNSNSDIIDDNLGQARQLALNIGYGYNNAVPYFVGDYCVYQNKLYKCIQNILTPEDFDETKWQQCTLGGELQNIKGNTDDNVTDILVKLKIGEKVYKICDFANENLANEYSALSTYEVGDYVIYEDDLYKCISNVSTAEPFDSNKWTECLITDEMGSGSGGSGGHTILDNDGTALTQRDEMQFVGTYSEDDSTNEITKINIVREMTKAEFDLLSDDEKTGIINVIDEPSGGSEGYIENTLWEGTQLCNDSSFHTLTLSGDITSYDMFFLVVSDTYDAIVTPLFITSETELNKEYINVPYSGTNLGAFIKLTASNSLDVARISQQMDITYTKVVGIKFGGASSGSDEIYSTDERAVGTWIDGSTIYQKTLHFVETSEQTHKAYSLQSLGIDIIISNEAFVRLGQSANNAWYTAPWWETSNAFITASAGVNDLQVTVGSSWKFTEVYSTLKYTKSTT